MSKSILVIDRPKDCTECQFCGWGGRNLEKYVCCLTKEHSEEPHLVGCPLKPIVKPRFNKYLIAEYIKIPANPKDESELPFFRKGLEEGWYGCLYDLGIDVKEIKNEQSSISD